MPRTNSVHQGDCLEVMDEIADGFRYALDFFEFFESQYGLPIANLEIITW